MPFGSLMAAVEAKVIAETSATAFATTPIARRQTIPPGTTLAYHVPAILRGAVDSNQTYQVALLPLQMAHRLANPADEKAYLDGDFRADLAVLMDPAFWTSLSDVFELLEGPTYREAERVGNVIEYGVTVQVKTTV